MTVDTTGYANEDSVNVGTEGALYRVSVTTEDSCSTASFSDNFTQYYQHGLSAPTFPSLLEIKGNQLCFFRLNSSGSSEFNFVKMEINQAGSVLDTVTEATQPSTTGVVCLTASSVDAAQEVDVEYMIGNNVTVEGELFTIFSTPATQAYNLTDYSIIRNHSIDCNGTICILSVAVDVPIGVDALLSAINFQWNSTDHSNSVNFTLSNTTYCTVNITRYSCEYTIDDFEENSSYSFAVDLFVHDFKLLGTITFAYSPQSEDVDGNYICDGGARVTAFNIGTLFFLTAAAMEVALL